MPSSCLAAPGRQAGERASERGFVFLHSKYFAFVTKAFFTLIPVACSSQRSNLFYKKGSVRSQLKESRSRTETALFCNSLIIWILCQGQSRVGKYIVPCFPVPCGGLFALLVFLPDHGWLSSRMIYYDHISTHAARLLWSLYGMRLVAMLR